LAYVIDLKGKRFGRLVAIRLAEPREDGFSRWICKCDCGQEATPLQSNLRRGKTRSCGCANRRPPGHAGFVQLFNFYKRAARKRGKEWKLTKAQFRKLTQGNCEYCSAEPMQVSVSSNPRLTPAGRQNTIYLYNGIDRVDNELGYLPDNCVSCCKVCNQIKMQFPLSDLMNHLEKMVSIYRQKKS
jgi:hypothetical protein